MPLRPLLVVVTLSALGAAPATVLAQSASIVAAPSPAARRFQHRKEIRAVRDARLVLLFGESGRAEAMSRRGWSDPGVQTNSHFLRFALPRAVLAQALQHDRVRLVVGGVKVGFQRDQLEALRDLLDRTASVGAPRSAPGGV